MTEIDVNRLVHIKNVDNERFVFAVNKQRYSIEVGEIRQFPYFQAELAVKHLIDKILIKSEPKGTLLNNQEKRAELLKVIVVRIEREEIVVPEEAQEVEENKPITADLETLIKNVKDEYVQEETTRENAPKTSDKAAGVPNIPTRKEMLEYAQSILKLNLEDKATKKSFEKLTDEQLYKELGMEVQ